MANAEATSPAVESEALDRETLVVAGVVLLGAIMSILDTTVVNVAINTLARDFHTALSTIQWVATGYTLALATVIPLTGWAADRFGTKRLYMLSIALFMTGSALSGLAWSAGSLIAFRVLQGLGGGMIMPAGMTILTRAAGPAIAPAALADVVVAGVRRNRAVITPKRARLLYFAARCSPAATERVLTHFMRRELAAG